MATKRQHFVPRTYLKKWETKVRKITNINNVKKQEDCKFGEEFNGLYKYTKDLFHYNLGDACNKESILYQDHIYTINFKKSMYIVKPCEKLYEEFVDKIYCVMRNGEKLVYAKWNNIIIKDKETIKKYFYNIYDWKFYYENGNLAKTDKIMRVIDDKNSYILENSFSDICESKWNEIYNNLLNEIECYKKISMCDNCYDNYFFRENNCSNCYFNKLILKKETVKEIIEFFIVLMCRNPLFTGLGSYDIIRDLFVKIFKFDEKNEFVKEMIDNIKYTLLYKLLFEKEDNIFYQSFIVGLSNKRIVLYEAKDDCNSFITSDNPVFIYKSFVESNNNNCLVFPISPKFLICIFNDSENNAPINVLEYRIADLYDIKKINTKIFNNKRDIIISKEKNLGMII